MADRGRRITCKYSATLTGKVMTYVVIVALFHYSSFVTGFFRLTSTVRTLRQSMYARRYDHIDNTQRVILSRTSDCISHVTDKQLFRTVARKPRMKFLLHLETRQCRPIRVRRGVLVSDPRSGLWVRHPAVPFYVTTLGKLFIHTCFCHQAV